MNGDLGKGPASTAVYATTNAIEQTLMGPAAAAAATGMAVLSAGPGGPTLQPATIMQTALVPAQAIAAATEYALVNGNMLTAAAAAAVGPPDAADYYDGGGGQVVAVNASPVSNDVGGAAGAVVGVGGASGITGDMHGGENGIPLERLKKLLTAQLEYYFSW